MGAFLLSQASPRCTMAAVAPGALKTALEGNSEYAVGA
jgi:hypothetical protein